MVLFVYRDPASRVCMVMRDVSGSVLGTFPAEETGYGTFAVSYFTTKAEGDHEI